MAEGLRRICNGLRMHHYSSAELATVPITMACRQCKTRPSHLYFRLFLNRGRRWGTTDDFTASQFPPFFSFPHRPPGLGELEACPFPDVVVPPLHLPVLSSSPIHCALRDGFGQTLWIGDMSILLQFASLYDRQEVFV